MALNELNEIVRKYNMEITSSKTKAMGFCERNIKGSN
jgi:hypothetical protein